MKNDGLGESGTCIIRITDCAARDFGGIFSSTAMESDVKFQNLMQLIFLIDDLAAEDEIPAAIRTHSSAVSAGGMLARKPETEDGGQENVLATFRVNVRFRRNASWQGSVVWIERNAESNFRSALELIHLIDSVLSGGHPAG